MVVCYIRHSSKQRGSLTFLCHENLQIAPLRQLFLDNLQYCISIIGMIHIVRLIQCTLSTLVIKEI